MTFKEFLQNEGLFGDIGSLNPGTLTHRIGKKSNQHPTMMRGTSVSRMLKSGPSVATTPTPTGVLFPGKQFTVAQQG